MITAIIDGSLRNRFLVLFATLLLITGGIWVARNTPLDAIPDLSDVQGIVFTEFPGQAPQVVEDQVTYPLTTAMLAVPHAKIVRAYSFFGYSFVYIILEDGTDMYWARSRVLEYLNYVSGRLPPAVRPSLGPDATGVGWVYEYALVDTTGRHDLADLRSIQDWYLRYALQTVSGVSEVASIGGYVKQYQIEVDPNALLAYDIPLSKVKHAIQRSNNDVGGRLIEMAETEYMVRGLAELNGEGEVTGGVVTMRYGGNALDTIKAVRAKLEDLKKGLPEGVEIVPVYDRGDLIERAVANLKDTLIEECIVVSLITTLFLLHLRSALVAIVTLPLGILIALIVMYWQGINANIMPLGGIAIAIGAIVMIENAHRHLELTAQRKGTALTAAERWPAIGEASREVGPALFFSLLIIAVSFLPVFTLQAQEGRLFSPLAFTKTYAMMGAALLAIVLVLTFIDHEVENRRQAKSDSLGNPARLTADEITEAVRTGTSERLRPIVMTAASTMAGLLPVTWGHGTGSEVMQRIAAPMVGGMLTVTILCLLVLPVIYSFLLQRLEISRSP